MKAASIITSLVFAASTTFAQKVKEADVPKTILEAFNNNFKGSKVKTWEKEKNGIYEAEFMVNKTEKSASFYPDGALFETETKIAVKDLPKTVADYIGKNYAGYKISEASQITVPSGSQTFEAEIKKDKEEIDLIFDSNGNFLSKEVEGKDEK